jgi:hypothetical protein
MAKGNHRPGGGIASRVNTERPVRTGSGSKSTRPAGVAMFGQMQGSHSTHFRTESSYRGERLHNPSKNFQPTPFGNEIAAKTTCGPGGSREVMSSGSQQRWGDVAGTRRPAGRGILTNE